MLCQRGVSYGVSAVFLCHAHRIKVLTGLSAAASTPGDLCRRHAMADDRVLRAYTVRPIATPPHGDATPRKRNQTEQLKRIKNLIYHFHIPLSHTTAQINQKVVYTTQIPVN